MGTWSGFGPSCYLSFLFFSNENFLQNVFSIVLPFGASALFIYSSKQPQKSQPAFPTGSLVLLSSQSCLCRDFPSACLFPTLQPCCQIPASCRITLFCSYSWKLKILCVSRYKAAHTDLLLL